MQQLNTQSQTIRLINIMQVLQTQFEEFSGQEMNCQICCLDKEDTVTLFNPAVICYQCWYQHLKSAVTRMEYKTGNDIISPFQGKMPVDVCVALNTLKPAHAKELEQWLFKKYSSFTTDIEKCPSENCDYVFMLEKCKWRTGGDEKCPKCDAVLLQATSFNIKGLIGFIYFLFLTNKCPKCEIPIEKTTGCPHMTCPCGHQFCWFCLKDYYSNGNNVYSSHEPKECAFIFLSKMAFMCICICGIVLTFLGNDVFHKFVSYFFVGLKYILLTIFIDLILISNFLVINHIVQKIRNHRLYGFDDRLSNIKFFIGALVFVDFLLMMIFYVVEIYGLIFSIIVIEVLVAALGALSVWMIVYSVETWFDYVG